MGSGKTTIGKLIHHKLLYTFIDSDNEIEKQLNLSVSKIFEEFGEEYFRLQEKQIINNILASNKTLVIATGGGAILDQETCANLREKSYVIFLDAHPNTLYDRLLNNNSRPLLQGQDKHELIKQKIIERQKLYLDTAHHSLQVDNLIPEQIVMHIAKFIAKTNPGKLPSKPMFKIMR